MKTKIMQNFVTTESYCFNYHNFADVNKLVVCTVQYFSSSSICGLDPLACSHVRINLTSRRYDLDRGSARRKVATYAGRHPCLEQDSNPQSQCSSGRSRMATVIILQCKDQFGYSRFFCCDESGIRRNLGPPPCGHMRVPCGQLYELCTERDVSSRVRPVQQPALIALITPNLHSSCFWGGVCLEFQHPD
jgi:hypothetical protein